MTPSYKNVIDVNRGFTAAERGRKSRETRPNNTRGMMDDRVEIMRIRHEEGLDIWTGETLGGNSGQDNGKV